MRFQIDGAKVRRLREARGWSRQELARASGVSRTLVFRVEEEEREDLRIGSALGIASALGVGLEKIVHPKLALGDSGLLVMMRYLEDLTPQERDSVQRFIEFVLNSRKGSRIDG